MLTQGLEKDVGSRRKRRIILVGHRYHLKREMKGVYDAFERRFSLRTVFVDDGWPTGIEEIPDYDTYDACIWFVRFRDLILRPAFRWNGFSGARIMYDWDVIQNYHHLSNSKYIGAWPKVFHHHGFHFLLCTGRQTRDLLESDGVPAYWLPKGYDSLHQFDSGLSRQGICYFGNRYVSRRAMLHYLRWKRIRYATFICQPNELNGYLNKYLGCLICNMGGIVRRGVGRIAHRVAPSYGVALEPGLEPMQKNFEVAAAGCAPIADWIDELAELGFEDGKTMVSYCTFEELAQKLRFYLNDPAALRDIGLRAGKLARERHTWDHRAEELDDLLAIYC